MSDLENLGRAGEGLHPNQEGHRVELVPDDASEGAPSEQEVTPVPMLPAARAQPAREPILLERYRRKAPLEQAEHPVLPPLPALPAPYKPQVVDCPICKGLGFTRRDLPVGHPDFGRVQPCQCTVQKRATLFGGARIPEEFAECSFESYLEQEIDAQQERVAMRIMQFLGERLSGVYTGHKRGLYLYGPWGVGKSGLAIAALRQAITAGKSGLYLSTSALLDLLRESIAASQRLARGYGDEEDKQEESAGARVLRLAETVEWLVLDDLGVECGTEFVVNKLYRIIEGRRLQKRLFTIFTSNKDAQGLEERWRPAKGGTGAFEDCYRVIERLGESCVVFQVTGRNLRQKEER